MAKARPSTSNPCRLGTDGMALPGALHPSQLTLDVLFPEEYARSKRMIVHDFAFFGASIVVAAVGLALFLQG